MHAVSSTVASSPSIYFLSGEQFLSTMADKKMVCNGSTGLTARKPISNTYHIGYESTGQLTGPLRKWLRTQKLKDQ